jgi:DNA repair exonuclease SbcCD ATPase subunit
MTSFKPSLKVSELTVLRGDAIVFSEKFHSGLNIISGENSSGKSSIMDFIFFGLGGDLAEHQWRETSLLCTSVIITVQLSGNTLTLKREIEPKKLRPMEIYFGEHAEAISAPATQWEKYPYSRGGGTSKKESFSQAIFRQLGLPEVRIEEQNVKITIHQLLRLLYSDQLTSVERIFRQQQPDDAITRSTVGDILLGAYSDDFYSATLRVKEADDELKAVIAQIKSIHDRYQVAGHPLTPEWLSSEISTLKSEIESITVEIETLEDQIFSTQFEDRLTLNDQEHTYASLVKLQTLLGDIRSKLDATELEISEATEFIVAMERKVDDLTNAKAVVEEYEYLDFDICPACLGLVDDQKVEGGCSLCKQPFQRGAVIDRSAKMLNEAIRQRDRSVNIQNERIAEQKKLAQELEKTRSLWEDASRHYRIALRSPTTELRSKLRDLTREAGYKNRQLEEVITKRSIVEELRQLGESREGLEAEIFSLRSTIERERRQNIERKSLSRQKIEELALGFLHDDLDRQSTFKNATKVDFDFEGDRLSVDGESFFSASSMVYLRNSFLAAFHFASASDPKFGHPRFLLMDTIEDKGMEQERSKHFQRLLADRATEMNSDHQIIIATSMIAEELNTPDFVIGQHYTHENRTLKIRT